MGRHGPTGDLEHGLEAYGACAWAEAHTYLTSADAGSLLGADELEALAMTAYMLGRHDDWCSGMERAHAAHRDAGAPLRAARVAFWLGFYHASRGDLALASGWLSRAGRLVEEAHQDCVESGYLLLPSVLQHRIAGDYEAAHDLAAEAARIGERFGDADLVCWARHEQGRALVRQGRADGFALLDEVMVAVRTGECSPLPTGQIYCSVIEACMEAFELGRAREWTVALTRWCEGQSDLVAYAGQCRVHRSQVMQLRGAWTEALTEARRAGERSSKGVGHPAAAGARYEEAEIHRLRGELTEAEESYRATSRLGHQPQPGLALLRVAQGRPEAAAATMQRLLREATDPLARARLLPACTEIMLAAGDAARARAASVELSSIAAAHASSVLTATAACALARVDLVEGDPTGALEQARSAGAVWRQEGIPYEEARAREVVGLACRALGDEDGGDLELEAARSTFADLGAHPDLARLEALLDRPGRSDHGLTPRELEMLGQVADGATNKAIAERFHLSEKTVDRHVSNILAKLAVTSRTAATAYAYEHHML